MSTDNPAPTTMGLPGTDLEQFKKQAKDWLRKGRRGDPEALDLLRHYHPRGAELADDPDGCGWPTRSSRWPARSTSPAGPSCASICELVQPWRRNPHRVAERSDPADEFVRLACLTYGADARNRPAQAVAMLEAAPELAAANVYAAAAARVADRPAAIPRRRSGVLNADGGPHRWPPLLYLCYSRIPDAPTRTVESGLRPAAARRRSRSGRRFLWEGLAPPSPR